MRRGTRHENKVGHPRRRSSNEKRDESAQTLEETNWLRQSSDHRITESLTPKTTSTTDDELRHQVREGQCPSTAGWPAPVLASQEYQR